MKVQPRRLPSAKPTEPPRSFGPWWEYRSRLISAAEDWSEGEGQEEAEAVAQATCAEVVRVLWNRLTDRDGRWFTPWRAGFSLPHRGRRLARRAAGALEHLSEIEASFLVGTLYTALLPPDLRTERGAYYTPPVLAERLLDLATTEGVDWSRANTLDPACGGGAFLAPVANRILNDHRIRCLDAAEQLDHLEAHLAGIEIDPFAAWLSKTFLQLLVFPVSRLVGRPLEVAVTVADALKLVMEDPRRFDLIVGNPPYGKVKLSREQRADFARSLYGHANLYGLFLDAALRWRRPEGLVAFLTPTSFLGGQYFSRLRDLLLDQAPPLVVDVIEARKGVFESVQQETCLTVFGPNPSRTAVLHMLQVNDRSIASRRAGVLSLEASSGGPWLLPRTSDQASLVARASEMRTRLHHFGYKASTGPLVWNRHKSQLRQRGGNAHPLIWAEAVRPNEFNFDYRSRASAPFFAVQNGQGHLICREPCVLLQRTTAKEQQRCLVACSVPRKFLDRWDGIVVENHVNVLRAFDGGSVSPETLAAVLNTEVVDQLFRCLSGSVAVSATELHALPLPSPEVFAEVEKVLKKKGAEPAIRHGAVEKIVARAYRG